MNSIPRWLMPFALIALAAGGLFLVTETAFAAGPQCASPYIQVQDGATPLLPDPNLNYTITSASMGEPFVNCTTKRLTVVMKVGSLAPAPPPNASWTVDFNTLNSQGQSLTFFVEYSTTINPAGGFNWGFHDTINDINLSQCLPLPGQPCEVTGTAAADGTITMHFVLTNPLTLSGLNGENFGTIGGMGSDPGAWKPGKLLSLIRAHTDVFIGAAGTGFSVANSATTGDGEYTVLGNLSCSNPPVAALAANTNSGPAPLTVNFDASGSNIPAGGCGTIASYIFDFGDGQQTTQATPTVPHTYNNPGTYAARVRVVSSVGVTSTNIAEQDITVTSAGPPLLQSVVSRKTHGLSGDFDVVLPQPPAARAIECRSGGVTNAYKLVFTFLNNLTSVASATVSGGAGSVPGNIGVIGPNLNQYTVDITGVTNAQTTTVTLGSARDSTGAVGNISAILPVLVGDANSSSRADAGDVTAVRNKTVSTTDATNFRFDVNASGRIDAGDVTATRNVIVNILP
jgi:PKD repeat protein